MGILNALGLMTRAEHERRRDESLARLESSLASKDETIEQICLERDAAIRNNVGLRKDVAAAEKVADERAVKIREIIDEIAALRPDAEAMRAKRKRDREQKAAKAEAALNKAAISNAAAAGLKVVASDKPAAKAPAKKAVRK